MAEDDVKITYNACQGWACHEHCVLTTYTKNGKVIRTERTVGKGPRAERGGICTKGLVEARLPYIKERLLYPLKRVGERGEGKFERISWDQALDEIGDKLCGIRDKYGMRSIMVSTFPCGLPMLQASQHFPLALRFIHATDCTRLHLPGVDQSCLTGDAIDLGNFYAMAMTDSDMIAGSKLLMIWGGNPIGYTRASHTSRILMDIQEDGGKIIDVGVVFDSSAAKADQFVPVKHGSDAALAMAMAKIIIDEGGVDEGALLRYTCAPLLVREDNGRYLRMSDLEEGGSDKVFLIWDENTDWASYIVQGDFNFDPSVKPMLDTEIEIAGIKCKTAFRLLKERLQDYTPEYQESITGVPAQTCIDIAREYMTTDEACIFVNLGLRYTNGVESVRAINLLPYLTGKFTKRNGWIINCPEADGYDADLNNYAMMYPDGLNGGYCPQFADILDGIDHPEKGGQQYKAFINPFSNPLHNWPNPQTVGKKFLDSMELVVVIDWRDSDTVAWADYVLPEASILERPEIISPVADCITYNEPAIEPRGESKTPAFIWTEIAKRFGYGQYFDRKTDEEWLEYRLQGMVDMAADGKPLTWERLKEEKMIQVKPPEGADPITHATLDFTTPTGRLEFYAESLYDIDEAMTKYIPLKKFAPEPDKYPLHFFPARSRQFVQAQFYEYPELRAIAVKESCTLNPKTAREYGIKEGDLIEVYNHRGKIVEFARISEAMPPDVATVYYAYPKKDHIADPPTVLSACLGTEETKTPLSVTWAAQWLKQNEEVGLKEVDVFQNGSMDTMETYWEDMCGIRKIADAGQEAEKMAKAIKEEKGE